MGAFQAKLSRAQREAVIRAVLADNLSHAEAARRAAKGQLDGAGRFEITRSYVSRLVRDATHERKPAELADPETAHTEIQEARARALALVLRAIDAWEKNARAGQYDWPEHGRLMRALREHETASKQRTSEHETEQDDRSNEETHTDASAILEQLRTLAGKPASNGATKAGSAASLSR
jgi:hypothetical protein